MGGGVHLSEVAVVTGISVVGAMEQERLADWCVRQAGSKMQGGAVIEADGLRVTLRKFRRKKVSEAAVALIAAVRIK